MHSQRRQVARSSQAVSVSIVGASGYSGLELVRLLLKHPRVRLEKLFANTSAGKNIGDVAPWFRSRLERKFEPYSPEAASTSDVVFLALPSGEAMTIVPELLGRGKRIVDLGGDFRLRDGALYEQYYHRTHQAPEQLATAVYGLPEWNTEQIRTASLVANPGCYPTSAILPLAPLLKEQCIEPGGISISSMSGVSGAGRSASADLSFVEVNETVKAYKVGVHQHHPEITAILESFAHSPVSIMFVPHLIPITRGIVTTTFTTLRAGATKNDVLNAYEQHYASSPFVRILPDRVPEVKSVNGTNFIDIGVHVDMNQRRLVVLSAIDNLLKGAAGQAVQNLNLMAGFEETEGLL
jgi:N-acetyl-gamma-glutamyl-phosphate reductase